MDKSEIYVQLLSVFRRVFENDSINIEDSTTADDIENWDSMTHLMLITEIEEDFSIEINGMDIMNLHNVGNLASLIERKKS
jgi:acyl carrier protein|tara:strand:- start:2446 stop:2688 length:243 start_codon:yes stop_codon:yes gene_type:complete